MWSRLPRGGARDDQHEIVVGRRAGEGALELGRPVAHDRRDVDRGPVLAEQAAQQRAVGVGDLARTQCAAGRPDLVARRDHGHARARAHRQARVPAGDRERELGRRQAPPRLEQPVPGGDVLAGRADVAAGRRRVQDARLAAAQLDLFARDDRIPVVGDVLAGVDRGERPGGQRDRRAGGVGGAHGDPVHRRAPMRRVRVPRVHVLRQHAAERRPHRARLHRHGRETPVGVERAEPVGERPLRRRVDQRVRRRDRRRCRR